MEGREGRRGECEGGVAVGWSEGRRGECEGGVAVGWSEEGKERVEKESELTHHILCLPPQIAGIIVDSYARGQYKHIWFSVSHDLRMDAERCVSKGEGEGG